MSVEIGNTPIKIVFEGTEYWWLREKDGSGALAPLHHCDDLGNVEVFEDSFAHVFENGKILRYGIEIGTRDDLTEAK